MKVVDFHVYLFPEYVVDEYMRDYVHHSNLLAPCRPALDVLFREYEGIEVVRYVILQEWQSSKPFQSENLKFIGENDNYYTRYYFYSFNRWLGKIQREDERIICFGDDDSGPVSESSAGAEGQSES